MRETLWAIIQQSSKIHEMKQYFLVALIFSVIAYTLYFLFAVAYNQPMGAYGFMNSFFYGFILHIPVWLITFLIGGLFNQSLYKLKSINQIIRISLCSILILFSITFFNSNAIDHFDFVNLIFYLFDFILCLLYFSKHLNRKR